MTRTTLLHVLDRPTALGPDEVRELEQLAQAFPYCQTAHLLLAKAAHDQGTMLAGQRLRRAATYAADRTLLRRLIEQMAPAAASTPLLEEPLAVPAEAPAAPTTASRPATLALAEAETTPAQATTEVELPVMPSPLLVSELLATANEVLEPQPEMPTAGMELPAPGAVPKVLPTTVAAFGESAGTAAPSEYVETSAPHPTAGAEPLPSAENPTPTVTETGVVAEPEPQLAAPLLVDLEGAQIPVAGPVGQDLPAAAPEAQADFVTPTLAEVQPAQAPAIRPPAEAGAARFEYGLAEAPSPPKPVYELPGLVDEFAASAVTLSMGSSELPAILLAEVAALGAPFTAAAFTGDATVGYAFGESSRLGLSLQLLDLLTAQSETAECSTAVVAAAQPPAGALPPAGTFFEPDPLLLDYWATHCPPPPPKPSPLDLINNFLRRQPRLTRPSMLPPTPTAQADLSVRSTNAEPDLVSENLARIFLRQGKTARAVEIYEKLMVKHPEKLAYFAAQIQSLQPSA